jgi:Ca2+/Na+ antiporter
MSDDLAGVTIVALGNSFPTVAIAMVIQPSHYVNDCSIPQLLNPFVRALIVLALTRVCVLGCVCDRARISPPTTRSRH